MLENEGAKMKQIKLHKKTKYLTKTTKPNKNRETRYRCYLSTREYPFLSLRNVLSHHTSTLQSIVITRETCLSSLFKWFSPFDRKIASGFTLNTWKNLRSNVWFDFLQLMASFDVGIYPLSVFWNPCVIRVLSGSSATFAPTEQSDNNPAPRARVLHDKRASHVPKTRIFGLLFESCTERAFPMVGINWSFLAFLIRDYRHRNLSKHSWQRSSRFAEPNWFGGTPSCHCPVP